MDVDIEQEDVIPVEMIDGIEEIVPAFLQAQKEGAASLPQMLLSSEFDSIRRFAHNLKGTGAAFGFPRLTEIGITMERSAKEANRSDLSGQIKSLIDYLNRVRVWRRGK
jgi:HPt (histidine-containing phosphotransfer) domain-containing protein